MSALQKRLTSSLDRRRANSKLRQLKSSVQGSIDFSSNDFLSLATTAALRKDLIQELQSHDLPIGSTGSRLLDGNSQFAEQLEKDIAQFHGAEAGLLTNSGFDANVSIFMCIPQDGDIIVYDELIHASVHDGMRQSRATTQVMFKHNCVSDLRRVLADFSNIDPLRNVFVATESVYSMDGDLAPLEDIVSVVEEMFPQQNCHLIVDEAHATGVYGPNGRGRVSELKLESKVLIRLHTFGKALACNGGIILCSDVIKQYLLNYARPLIYTTFMSYPSLAAIKVVYAWLQAGRTEELALRLLSLTKYMHARLASLRNLLQTSQHPKLLHIAYECPQSPIFALMTSEPRQLALHCQTAGFVVRAVVAPTVPEGTERVRVCLHASNTFEQIDQLVLCVREWLLLRTAMTQSVNTSPSFEATRQKSLLVPTGSGMMLAARDGTERLSSKL